MPEAQLGASKFFHPPVSAKTESITVIDLQNLIVELRMLARGVLSSEKNPQSLTPTALVLTAIQRLKLSNQNWDDVRWENRAHFFDAIARAMRNALIDRARWLHAKGRDKVVSVPFDDRMLLSLPSSMEERPYIYILLDEALEELRKEDPLLAHVLDQFYFAGFEVSDIQRFLSVSEKTVDRKLRDARLALKSKMKRLMTAA